jgi:pimeloyl-ACP methyl ester carboxylesterase
MHELRSGQEARPLNHDDARLIRVTGGRQLAVQISGPTGGVPVFLFHGTPGSRTGPQPRHTVLHRLGIRLISYDRPGYGWSSRRQGRAVADAATDVGLIADHLGVDRFAVVGRSGGGPHALACAAKLADRVIRTAVLVSLARPDAADLDWFDGMTASNQDAFGRAHVDALALLDGIRRRADELARDPESMVVTIESEMAAADRHVVGDRVIRSQLVKTFSEAMRHGPYGWHDDILALRREWGFEFDAITGPVYLWHGTEDRFAPASHSLWLKRRIKGAAITLQPGAAHFTALEVLPELLKWAVSGIRTGAGR